MGGLPGRLGESDPLATLLSHAKIGVQLFFVISGFVIALPFAKGHLCGSKLPRLKQFFFRRLTRLEPPYFLNLLVCYLLSILVTEKTASGLLPHLLASMGYVHNISYGSMSAINIVAWSLEVEIQFYILAPLITSIFMISSKTYRRALLVVIIAAFSSINYFHAIGGLSVLSNAQYFLTGFLLVDVYLTDWNQNPEKTATWDLVSILTWGTICALMFQGVVGKAFIVVPMFVAYYAAFKGTWSNKFFCQPTIYTIGGMCYTIYLYHFIAISGFGRVLTPLNFINQTPLWLSIIIASTILIPVILLCCTFLFVFTEKPFMKKDWHLKLPPLFNNSNNREAVLSGTRIKTTE